MELRDYLHILRPYLALLIAIPVGLFLLGYVLSARQPVKYDASTTLTVEKQQAVPQAASNFYQYDKYYAQLAGTIFADTVAGWLRSPGPVVEIYTRAGLPVPSGSAADVGRVFRVGKGQNTTVMVLTVTDVSADNARKIIETAKSVVNDKIAELKSKNNDPSYFLISSTPTETFTVKPQPILTALLGGISGLIVAFALAFILAYLFPARPQK